jgi:hypothetical protein
MRNRKGVGRVAYELWNRESFNLVGEFNTEDQARIFITSMVHAHGRDVVLPWSITFEDDDEETHLLAVGLDLLHDPWQPSEAENHRQRSTGEFAAPQRENSTLRQPGTEAEAIDRSRGGGVPS